MNGEPANGKLDDLFREMAEKDGLAAFLGPATGAGGEPVMKFCSCRDCSWEASITDSAIRCPECDGPIATGLQRRGRR
ncbi:MAG: hypothetical protein ACREN2_02230 [Candidatus Dormibacteria bacterium]